MDAIRAKQPRDFVKKDERKGDTRVTHVQTSLKPIKAPANFLSLKPQEGDLDDGAEADWRGSGIATTLCCEHCGNKEGNTLILQNKGYTYPNGNSWNNTEVLCGKCGVFSYVTKFAEG